MELKMKSKLLAILMSLAMAFTMMPMMTGAVHAETSYNLWVGGEEVTSSHLSGEGWSYNPSSNKLTLTNADITGAYNTNAGMVNIYAYRKDVSMEIELIGDNHLSNAYFGINCVVKELKITGSGSLNSDGEVRSYNKLQISGTEASTGGMHGDPLIIQNSSVSTNGGSRSTISSGSNGVTINNSYVNALSSAWALWLNGGLTVSGNSTLQMQGGDYAAWIQGSLTMNDQNKVLYPNNAIIAAAGAGKTIYESDGTTRAKNVVIGKTLPRYNVTFADEDGTPIISSPMDYGVTPSYTGATPTKEPTVEHLYTFSDWTPQIGMVTADVIYTAVFAESDRVYTGPVWTWTDYTEARATFTAADDTSFTQELTAVGDAITNEVTTPPTCEKNGERTYTAMVTFLGNQSSDTATEEIDPIGHKYGAWTKLDAEQHQRVCEHDAAHVEKENHKWDAGKVMKKASAKATGVRTYTCTVCKATKTKTIPKLKPSAPKISGTPLAKVTAKSKSITISWNKIQGAAGYDIFFARCNHDNKKIATKNVKTIKGNKTFKWTKSGLKKGTAYKAYVRAYVYKNGKKTYVRNSPLMHAYTGNGTKNYTNAKSVTVNKTKVTLKKGKTFKIKAKVNKVNKKKKLMSKSHAPTLRYMTSNSKVATVSPSGKITAKGKGTCYIYVFAHNGVSKQIKVDCQVTAI